MTPYQLAGLYVFSLGSNDEYILLALVTLAFQYGLCCAMLALFGIIAVMIDWRCLPWSCLWESNDIIILCSACPS